MQKILLLLLMFSMSETTFAQTTDTENNVSSDEKIYYDVNSKPEFVGGMQEFYNFVGQEFKVPNVKKLKGNILVQFVVEKDGSLSDIKVLKDIGHGTKEETIRVLSKSPKWIAGKQKGIPVRVLYTLPITIASSK
ncbi:energy transducer TonB [Flavobacterium soli]|uniref:energy transducer TonB n=1 Tax=Flavobacterium soli TaxID=344881 RepID=UPI00041879A9|nr:energy transducer TonB [Flavobacterium soli]